MRVGHLRINPISQSATLELALSRKARDRVDEDLEGSSKCWEHFGSVTVRAHFHPAPFFFGHHVIAKAPYYRHKTAAAVSIGFVRAIATQGFSRTALMTDSRTRSGLEIR